MRMVICFYHNKLIILAIELYREIAESIENNIYGLFNSDSNKNYRDKVNAMRNEAQSLIFFYLFPLINTC